MAVAAGMPMADVGKIYPADLHLLKKELEVQGELLTTERMERKTEVDELRLEVEALKKLLDRMNPGFLRSFEAAYAEERQRFNPELRKQTGS